MTDRIFQILFVFVSLTLIGCATSGDTEKITNESFANSVLFQAYIQGDFVRDECRMYALEVDKILQSLESDEFEPHNLRVSIYETVRIEIGNHHPTKGQWRITFDVETTKGIQTYNLLNNAAKSGPPEIEVQMMGTTLTDPILQADVIFPVLMGALLETKNLYSDYDVYDPEIFVINTQVISGSDNISPDGRISGEWTEEWTVQYFSEKFPVPVYIDFDPIAGGGTDFKVYTDSQESILIIM